MNKQVDLFLDSIVDAPVKDDQKLMEFPFFSLQKNAKYEPMIYEKGEIKVEIRPGDKGVATIWDKDILIYVMTLINEQIERGLEPSKTVRFNAYDLLRLTGRTGKAGAAGKRQYELLFDALFRLKSTTIVTSIAADGLTERRGFSWVDSFKTIDRINEKGKQVMGGVEITLNEWMFRAITKDRRVLTINKEYFKLTKGLERRLYEIARKHCGRQLKWNIGMVKLADKCGTSVDLRRFKYQLKKIIEDDRVPDYHIAMTFDPNEKPTEEWMDSKRWGSNRRIIVTFWPKRIIRGMAHLE